MNRRVIQPIVEGHGEVAAVPELLRRFQAETGLYDFQIARPIRRDLPEFLNESPLRDAIQLALGTPSCTGILILFDSGKDCPKEVAPKVESWARDEARDIPCAVVMAHREYEAWFLGAIESLRGKCAIREDAAFTGDPEGPRGAKERLEQMMPANRGYDERADQPKLTASFDFAAAYERCRSFRKMVAAWKYLVVANGVDPGDWPPAEWVPAQDR